MVASISATARVSSPVTSVRRAGAARSTAVRLAPSTGRPAQRQVFTFATDEKARDRSAEDAARYKFERDGQATAKDNVYVGGFAGGEKNLQYYKESAAKDKGAEGGKKPLHRYTEIQYETGAPEDTPNMKDGLVGGLMGGEAGVKAFSASGEIPSKKADSGPTIPNPLIIILLLFSLVSFVGGYLLLENGGTISDLL